MMHDDYVKRSDVHKAFQPKYAPAINRTFAAMIDSVPSADVVEVQYCRFNLEEARRRESVYKCSACRNYLTVRADMNYCPFCGRKVIHKGQDEGGTDRDRT